MKTDIEIARAARKKPIQEIGAALGIEDSALLPYGNDKAKIDLDFIDSLEQRPNGRLILVTAMTPTPAGEGKTTTTVGLGDAMRRIGKHTAICLREPSLGPCFGMKGGAAGGGHAQIVPMEDINLHFTGDFHAVGAANNLLAALIDNHYYWGNEQNLDARRISWRRVVDMNDRALRDIVASLGGVANGFPRQTGYDITVASEIMAILCLSTNLKDLEQRIRRIIIGQRFDRSHVTADQLNASGAMTVLLRDALKPNLVQSLEHTPAFVHGGPFANIAHGCNSLIATRTALKLADYVVTEAGFGADLGAEKFFNIKCRQGNLKPDAAVVVATIRALKFQGGVAMDRLGQPDPDALKKGLENLGAHIRNMGQFGVPAVVAINRFASDQDEEVRDVFDYCRDLGVNAHECNHWAEGGAGALSLAEDVVRIADSGSSQFRTLYADKMQLWEKARHIARTIYHADDIIADKKVRDQFRALQEQGFGDLPICMAKTQYSFSTDPLLKGAPDHHVTPIREVRLAAGAGFIVAICGEIMTMPGLPRRPAAESIGIDETTGLTEGLF
ncbi:MAG: formate--tetrahydrofolate ligase [Hyphomicrobiales bacterium]|nr:MAG: formate--tetrahydrofolate ligase [Hyphomicrobiales bacterium]